MARVRNSLLAVVALLAFFAGLEALLTLVGVTPALDDEDPLAGFAPAVSLYVPAPANRERWITRKNKRSIFHVQRFDRRKPADVYRIFCLGGSTTHGRPYGDATSFCGWLRELLPLADASHRWELINAGAISYGSYRIAALAEELARYEPDAFIVYTGHNESLERQTYEQMFGSPQLLLNSRAALSRTRTYTALRQLIAATTGRPVPAPMQQQAPLRNARKWLDQSLGPDAYRRDDRVARDTQEHFRRNLARIDRAAREVDAAVTFIVPASNLRDSTPFKSVTDAAMNPANQRRLASLLESARRDRAQGRPESALAAIERAVAIDARHAHAQYLRGQLLYDAERYSEAADAFRRARDEDVCPLRAVSSVVDSVRDVARERDAVVVDFERVLEQRSEHGIAGDDQFFDHVHPTIETNRLIALEVIDALRTAGSLELGPGWTPAAIAEAVARVESQIGPDDHARALASTSSVYTWAHKHEDAYRLALRAAEFSNAVEVLGNAADIATRLGRHDEALTLNTRLLEQHPGNARAHYDVAKLLADQGERERARESVQRALELNPQLPGARALLDSLSVPSPDRPRSSQ